MGFDKLFADLGGEPVLARTLRAFQACEAVSEIIVVAAEARVGEVASLAANIGAGKVAAAIPGGAERHQSVWRGRCLQNILSEFESRWCLCNNNSAHRSSLEWTPPCHGGDHRFKSGMGR